MQHAFDDVIVAAGLAPNAFLLGINHCLTVPDDFTLDGIWAYPSNMFRFPIRYHNGKLAVCVPGLKDPPFVRHVEAVLEMDLPVEDVGMNLSGTWAHARDLIRREKYAELLETRQFTDDWSIKGAVASCLTYASGAAASERAMTIKKAREVLTMFGFKEEPFDPADIRGLWRPSPVVSDEGVTRWPVNSGASGRDPHNDPWLAMHALERGYFTMKTGFIEWTQAGRDFHAGDSFGTLI